MAQRRSSAEWARLVKQWRGSGRTRAEFAAAAGVQPSTLTWWAWRLGLSLRERRVEPHRDRSGGAKALKFLPVHMVETRPVVPPETAIEIAAGSCVVRVRRGFDRESLAAVLEVLAEDDEC